MSLVDKIIKEIMEKRPNMTRQEIRSVATDILYSGECPDTVLASSSTIDKLIEGYRSRQTAAGRQSVAANDPTICPVCNLPLKPVKLANDRKAVYCSKHFVVFPIRPEEKGE